MQSLETVPKARSREANDRSLDFGNLDRSPFLPARGYRDSQTQSLQGVFRARRRSLPLLQILEEALQLKLVGLFESIRKVLEVIERG